MRAMQYDKYIRPIKRRDGKPTAHEIRIHVTDPVERAILGKHSLTKFLASGGDRAKAERLAQPLMPRLLAQKHEIERRARGERIERVMTLDFLDKADSNRFITNAIIAARIAGANCLRLASPEERGAINGQVGRSGHQEAIAASQPSEMPMPVQSSPRLDPVTTDMVIKLWIAERTQARNPPSDGAVAIYRRKFETMFGHLGMPDDFRLITPEILRDYRRDLVMENVAVTDSRGRKPNPRDHLEIIRAMCGVAARGYLPTNPAKDLKIPPKADVTRMMMTHEERATVLDKARTAEPVVKWAHWVSAFTSAIPTELRLLTPAHVSMQEDGLRDAPKALEQAAKLRPAERGASPATSPALSAAPMLWVIDIRPPPGGKLKTASRPRLLPLATELITEGFLDYVTSVRRDHGDHAPLFPMSTTKFSKRLNKLIRDCEILEPLKTFYSHRHYVCTELEGFKIVDEKGRQIDVSRYVAGHAALDVHERNYVHRSLRQVLKAIDDTLSVRRK